MRLSVAYIVQNEEEWIKHSLESVLSVADEIVIVDGGSTDRTIDIIDEFDDSRIKIIHHKWKSDFRGMDGLQKNQYLKYLTGDWCLIVDGDEVVSDNIIHLKRFLAQTKYSLFDVHMEHFIRDFGHVDATKEKHYVPRRLFKIEGDEVYPISTHTVLSKKRTIVDQTDAITMFHMGYVKSLMNTHNKFLMNMRQQSAHGPDFLKQWNRQHLLGQYPVRKYSGPYPRCVRRML